MASMAMQRTSPMGPGLDGSPGGARLYRHGEHGGSARAVPSESRGVAGGANDDGK